MRFFDFMFISGIDPKTLGFLNNVVALSYIAIWRMASFIKFHNSKSSTISAWDRTS
ncbi:CcdC protein domain-containing protein [Paenibacillus pabuli]|uniref:CcdC protein domain-containing protein n=1 Tax=Paenibacillus pabuli TaxID=1472 RepID=UPI003D7E86AF